MQVLDTLVALANLQARALPVSPILNQRKNELIKLLPGWDKAETSGIFAENFFLDYFPDALRKEATAIFNNAGKIVSVKEIMPSNNLRGSFLMEGEKRYRNILYPNTGEPAFNPGIPNKRKRKKVNSDKVIFSYLM